MAVDLGKLPAAHDVPDTTPAGKSTRGRKAGSKAKVRAELPPDAFAIEEVPEDERGTVRRIRVERSKQQIAIDGKVLEVYRKWVAAGKPAKWTEMPVQMWPLDARYVEDALFFLGKGATLHGKKLIVGNVSNKQQNGRPYPDGKTRIPFCVIDHKKKAPASVPSDNVSEGE